MIFLFTMQTQTTMLPPGTEPVLIDQQECMTWLLSTRLPTPPNGKFRRGLFERMDCPADAFRKDDKPKYNNQILFNTIDIKICIVTYSQSPLYAVSRPETERRRRKQMWSVHTGSNSGASFVNLCSRLWINPPVNPSTNRKTRYQDSRQRKCEVCRFARE
jgi:hypothetical protein